MELIAVVMGCETSKIRTAACQAMLDYGFANYALVSPQPEQTLQVPVYLGKSASVEAVPGAEPRLLIDKALKSGVTTAVELPESVPAPVCSGQTLGTLVVRSGEQELARIPLVAAAEVPRLTWGELIVMVLRAVSMAKPEENALSTAG